MSGREKRSLEARGKPAAWNAHFILWSCVVLLLLSAVCASQFLKGRRLNPTVSTWKIAKHELRIRVALLNHTQHSLYYSHHPFPVRFLIDGSWVDADVSNAYRSARIEPRAELTAEVLVAEPGRRPSQFQVGTDFEVQRVVPGWLQRVNNSLWAKPFRRLLTPMLQSLEQPKPVPCAWSKEVSIAEQDWAIAE